MIGRCIYIWKLGQILTAEGGINRTIDKAKRAKISKLWIKIADGPRLHENVRTATAANALTELIARAHSKDIQVWGWQVPYCVNSEGDDDQARERLATQEAATLSDAAERFALDGMIMDAEGGPEYFRGNMRQAEIYGARLRDAATRIGKPLAISSNDIPQNFPDWLPRFTKIASFADYNFPQTYYGASPSVVSRVDRAARANAHLTIPFVPVGAGWLGGGGGCESAQACAEKAKAFIQLCAQREYIGYSFWHWGGAPLALWELLNSG